MLARRFRSKRRASGRRNRPESSRFPEIPAARLGISISFGGGPKAPPVRRASGLRKAAGQRKGPRYNPYGRLSQRRRPKLMSDISSLLTAFLAPARAPKG